MHGNILYTFDYRADPVAHLFLHAHTLISLSYPQTLLFRTYVSFTLAVTRVLRMWPNLNVL